MILLTGNFERRRSALSRRTLRQGFTFLELMTVLLILGVLTSLTMPSLSVTARGFSFSHQVSRIQALLRYIQRHAVLEQRIYRVHIEPWGAGKKIEWRNSDAGPEEWAVWSSSLAVHAFTATSLEWRNEQAISIVFAPDGSLTSADIPLQDGRGNQARIHTSLSGEILTQNIL